jgi:predicted nucleic acid-binding protein
MNDNFFLDTNIFVYSVLPAEAQKRVRALDLIDRAISTGKANCRILYTEDLQHGQKFSDLRVVSPFA